MNLRQLGNSGLFLSELGFGAWAIGGDNWAFGWGPQDDNDAIAAIQTAIDSGVNWIDTAAVYGLGHSEELVARAIKDRRNRVIIATKCSLIWDKTGKISSCLKRESIRAECEASLKRLNTEYIDLYQIHWPDDEKYIEDGWEEIGRLIEEGKVRYGGVSNFEIAHLKRTQKLRPITSLQPPYSLLRRAVEGDIFNYCRRQNIGLVAYSPLQCGLLTGKFDIQRLAENDWRRQSIEFNEPNLSENLWLANELKKIAAKYGKTPGQLAVAWVLRQDIVTSAIVGGRSPDQVKENIGGTGWKIAEKDLQAIDKILAERIRRIKEVGGTVRE